MEHGFSAWSPGARSSNRVGRGHVCVLTVGLCGGHVGEQQQSRVLGQAAEQHQAAEQQLRQPPGEAAAVGAEVDHGNQVARGRVEADAASPDVALRHQADGGADRREVVWHLVQSTQTKTNGRAEQTDPSAYPSTVNF